MLLTVASIQIYYLKYFKEETMDVGATARHKALEH